jgi:hypothetical protein
MFYTGIWFDVRGSLVVALCSWHDGIVELSCGNFSGIVAVTTP